jgi:hypothetical protein
MNHFEDAATIERETSPVVKKSELDALLHFLQHGYLPWWYSSGPAWHPEWLQKLTKENWKELRNFLAADFEKDVHDENTLIRLISQFNDKFLISLLNGLQLKEPVEKAWSWLISFYEILQKTETASFRKGSLPSFYAFRLHFWKKWISYAAGSSAIPELATFFTHIGQPSLITTFLSGIAEDDERMDNIPQFWHRELIILKQQEYKNSPELSVSSGFVNPAKSEKFKETGKAGYSGKEDFIAKEDFILIPDAGLVLLHPFLRQLFESCHWLNENEFVNDEARNRAVYALHYLAAGDEEAPEYILMLPKLLCGIPLDWPLGQAMPLTDAEKEACDEMLLQVIGYWKALRNTSLAGLRGIFLRRQGKLSFPDEGWRLEVQRKTEDILLNRLPWGISMIKFSWMPRLLSVSWE